MLHTVLQNFQLNFFPPRVDQDNLINLKFSIFGHMFACFNVVFVTCQDRSPHFGEITFPH